MKLAIHVHLHLEPGPGLDSVIELGREILKETRKMSAELDRLTSEVAENTTVVNSAITLIEGLAERIREIATDPAALNALADSLDTDANRLAAAVEANTPSEPPPPVPPPSA